MALLENSFLIIGIAMCVLALLPLAFWSAQSWATLKHNRMQFRESQRLLREQILAANARRVADTATTPAPSKAPATESPNVQVQEQPAVANVSQATAADEVVPIKSTEVTVEPDGTWRGFRKFLVKKLAKETSTCTSVYLEPVDGKPIASFKAGQHLAMRFHVPGQTKPVVRCYSLSDGSGKPYYRITVKAIEAGNADQSPGLISNFINDQLKLGDVVESKAPAGSFCLDPSGSRPIVMLAGGIGVTPMISIINSVLEQSPNRPMILLYGVRNKSELAFDGELRRMKQFSEHFHVLYCFSAPSADEVKGRDYQVQGYVSIDLIKQLLPKKDCQYYLCGPPQFMQSLNEGLESWGVPDSQVHTEAFGPSSICKARPPVSTPESAGAIEVAFKEVNQTVTWDPSCESLLELAESNGVYYRATSSIPKTYRLIANRGNV